MIHIDRARRELDILDFTLEESNKTMINATHKILDILNQFDERTVATIINTLYGVIMEGQTLTPVIDLSNDDWEYYITLEVGAATYDISRNKRDINLFRYFDNDFNKQYLHKKAIDINNRDEFLAAINETLDYTYLELFEKEILRTLIIVCKDMELPFDYSSKPKMFNWDFANSKLVDIILDKGNK